MSSEEFQKRARLYVIGALEPEEAREFEKVRKRMGQKGQDIVAQCYALHEVFALSLRPARANAATKDRLMAMVRERKES
jgi:hypothetical protein